MKNDYYHKKEHPFPSQNHYSYVYFREFITKLWLILKCWNAPSPTFQGVYFEKFWEWRFFPLPSLFLGENNPIYQISSKSESEWCDRLGDLTENSPILSFSYWILEKKKVNFFLLLRGKNQQYCVVHYSLFLGTNFFQK